MKVFVAICLLGFAASSLGVTFQKTVDVDMHVTKDTVGHGKMGTMSMGNAAAQMMGASIYIQEAINQTNNVVLSAAAAMTYVKDENDALEKQAEGLVAALSDADKALDDAEDAMAATLKKAKTDMTAYANTMGSSIDDSITAGVADIHRTITAQVSTYLKSTETLLESKMSATRHIFSGRSRTWGDRGGWKDFIVNQVEYDNAKPMFQLRTTTRFRALKTGVYHIMWWSMQHGGRCHAHSRIRYDSGAWLMNHNHNWLTDGAWEGNQLDLYWKFNANKDFWTTHSNGCGHRWHISPSNLDDGNSYNRIFVEYVGQVLDDKGNAVRWNGPQ